MFITCSKHNGVKYLQLAKNISIKKNNYVKSRNRIIKNIGALSKFDDGKPNYLQRLRQSFKDGKPLIKELSEYVKLEKLVTVVFNKDDTEYLNPKNIGYFFIKPYLQELGILDVLSAYKSKSKIKYDLAGILKLLTYGRILNPKSKLSTIEQNKDYLLFPVNNLKEQDVYKSLDILDKLSFKIQKRIDTKIKQSSIGRNNELIFYDVTNTYFETAYNDDDTKDENGEIVNFGLRKKGVSKEYRPNPIIQFGLFIDSNGIPISYKIFPENNLDTTTLRPAINETIKNYDYKRTIVVADRGLNSDKNIAFLLKNNNGYIFSKTIKKSKTEVKDWILDKLDYKDINNKVPTDNTNFKLKSRIIKRQIKDENGVIRTIKEKQIVYWSLKHYLREVEQNKKFMEHLDKVIEFPDKLKDKQAKINYFLKTFYTDKKTGETVNVKQNRIVNIDKVKQWMDLMGYYLICSSEIDKENLEIIKHYKGLSKIEDSFRITKHDLKLRPIYVWDKKQHINAHFLICFISLLIIRLIQLRVLEQDKSYNKNFINDWEQGITAEKLKDALNGLNINELKNGFCQISKPNTDLLNILKAIDKELKLNINSIQEANQLMSNINKKIIL
jgi:transposase